MSDPTRIKELRKEIESLCGNCDRPDKEQLGEIIISSMALGFSYGMEADRPQGKWIVRDGVFYCSCCNNDSAGLSEDDVNLYGLSLPNYCQDCGAKMKGAVDDI